jgi:hypothetical protein
MGFGVPYHVCNQCFYKYYRLCQDFFVFEWMGGEVARSFEDSYLKWDEMTEIYECKPGSRPVLLPDWSCSRGNPPVFLGKKTLV